MDDINTKARLKEFVRAVRENLATQLKETDGVKTAYVWGNGEEIVPITTFTAVPKLWFRLDQHSAIWAKETSSALLVRLLAGIDEKMSLPVKWLPGAAYFTMGVVEFPSNQYGYSDNAHIVVTLYVSKVV